MRARLSALVIAGLVLFSASAFAESKARIVRLSYLEGTVQLDRGDGNGYIRAFLNMPLVEGASLWTHADGRVEVEFEDGSTARLAPNTIVVFTELRLRADGSKLTSLTLSDGVVYFHAKHERDDAFRVFAGDRELQLEKTSSFRVVHSARQDPFDLRVAVFKGELRFIQPDSQRVAIKKNETLTLDLGEPDNRYFLSRGIVEEAHDYWDRERDEDRVILARRQSSDTVYYSDLNRYGTFITVGSYGQVWRPFGMAVSWDPFGHGAWVYYPGHGYVWVSNYIWGWTPYRYGAWVHVSGYGWCWRPAGMYRPGYHRWNPHPVIVNAPAGYVAPVPPTTPSIPIVRVAGGRLDPPVRDGRVRPLDGPEGSDGESGMIQDRIRGVRSADTRFPRGGRTADPVVDTRVPDGSGRAGDPSQPTGRMDGRPARSSRIADNPNPAGDTPARTEPGRVTPQGTGTPLSPAVGDRPSRPARLETPDPPVIQDRAPRPTRGEVATPTQTAPPVQTAPPPVMNDRPSRPARVETPPQPRPQPQMQPSSPPPQRVAPAPSAPAPSAPAPRVNDAPTRTPRTSTRDQSPL